VHEGFAGGRYIAGSLRTVRPPAGARQEIQPVDQGTHRVGLALLKRAPIGGAGCVGQFAQPGVELAAIGGGQRPEQVHHRVLSRRHPDVAVVGGAATTFPHPGGVDPPDNRGDRVAGPLPGQPDPIRPGGGEDLGQGQAFDLGDVLIGHGAGGAGDQPRPVGVEQPRGHRRPHPRQPVRQHGTQLDQPAGLTAAHRQRRPHLRLGDLRPTIDLLAGGLTQPVLGELGDHRQLALHHHRLHPMQLGHRVDQPGRGQRGDSGNCLAHHLHQIDHMFDSNVSACK